MNDLLGQGNPMRVVQTLEALRKVANPSSGVAAATAAAAAADTGNGGVGDDIGDSKPPRSTMEKKAESLIPAPSTMTKTTPPGPFIVKGISGVMGSHFLFPSCLIDTI